MFEDPETDRKKATEKADEAKALADAEYAAREALEWEAYLIAKREGYV